MLNLTKETLEPALSCVLERLWPGTACINELDKDSDFDQLVELVNEELYDAIDPETDADIDSVKDMAETFAEWLYDVQEPIANHDAIKALLGFAGL